MEHPKYGCLEAYLREVPTGEREVRLTFREIDELLTEAGHGPLPQSAREGRPWWANVAGEHNRVQSAAWHNAGWEVASVDLGVGMVVFRRL